MKYRLLAIDHSHAITDGRSIGASLTHIEAIKDTQLYGLFDEFRWFLSQSTIFAASASIDRITDNQIDSVISEIPVQWQVDAKQRAAIRIFLCERRNYLRNTLVEALLAEANDSYSLERERME